MSKKLERYLRVKAKPQMDGRNDEGCREAGSQKLEEAKDRDGWRRLLESAKTLHGL
jgi:hypothetical protein